MKNNNSDFVLDSPELFKVKESRLHIKNDNATRLVYHLDHALENALSEKSKLPAIMTTHSLGVNTSIPNDKKLLGFSGVCFRHLMNNLCSLKGANYLEVGIFRGSTLISSVYGNEDTLGEVHAIDNYSEFAELSIEHPKSSYNRYLDMFLPNSKEKIQFHETDCFEFDITTLPKIDIYFYDGEHSADAQYKAFKYFEPAFADVFIAVVDDWEQKQVREGTRKAFEEIGYDVVATRAIIPFQRDNNENRVNNPTVSWWNGTHVSVLRKRDIQE